MGSGALPHRTIIDMVANRDALFNYNFESISMLVIDNTLSGVDDIMGQLEES